MNTKTKIQPNHLINETSPYLLQHAYNPVNWYPWGEEAFNKAKTENKPIFLSIGYSTCHWCHVMERESFEDNTVASILNQHFVSIKVDKEERPDIDSIYMRVCQAYTESGGWPTSILITPDQKPFFAGTYFPKDVFINLLKNVHQKWAESKELIVESGDEIIDFLNKSQRESKSVNKNLPADALELFKRSFDSVYGGFGMQPKFPTPHNLLFLMRYYEQTKDKMALQMAEKTLIQMYKGGIFDHIGYGFSRYSTDRFWLAPHFEKMLYDNALLSMAYLYAYEITANEFYKKIAEKVFIYIERELTDKDGGFYCAQDADSDGVEGKYYILSPREIIDVLGQERGEFFNNYFDITLKGNFEGKNIPNLIKQDTFEDDKIDKLLPKVYEYRKSKTSLHKDNKILTSWNSLMIAALATAYRVLGNSQYLEQAQRAVKFIEANLSENDTLFVSITDSKRSGKGFLDDYAFYIFALISLYEATFNKKYLQRAEELTLKTISEFYDEQNNGFFLYGKENEQLIIKPKETYDGAIPAGNSVMAYNLTRLATITKNEELYQLSEKHKQFMDTAASSYPAGNSFYLFSMFPTKDIVCVLKNKNDIEQLEKQIGWLYTILEEPTEQYPLVNDKTTFYVCEGNSCLPPTNKI